MPTSRMRAPDLARISGMRKPPPISTSSPRETMTSAPSARELSARNVAAAQLFTTTAAFVESANSSSMVRALMLSNCKSSFSA